MESLAKVVESHKGEAIEVVTNAGQRLGGIVIEADEDFFTLSSVTQVYIIPYDGISTIQWPSERPKPYAQSRTTSIQTAGPPATRKRGKPSGRKDSGRAPR